MPAKVPSKKSVEDLVKKSMPGWRVVTEDVTADSVESDADSQSIDLAALRRKYLGNEAADSVDSGGNAPTKIVVVEPENADAYHRRSGRKAIVVADDKIIGAQG